MYGTQFIQKGTWIHKAGETKMRKKRPASPIKDRIQVLNIQDFLKSKNERDYMLFILGISTGYRAGDLVKLQVRDIKQAMDKGYFEILEGKKVNSKNIRKENIKPRVVKIISNLEKLLKRYIKNKKDYEYLFKSRKGKNRPIEVASVTRILKEAAEEFELKNITAHSMRKTYAYSIYVESEYDLLLVKEMLGHSSIEETKLYLGLDRETYDKYSDTLNNLIRV
jgi:integrase